MTMIKVNYFNILFNKKNRAKSNLLWAKAQNGMHMLHFYIVGRLVHAVLDLIIKM